MPVLCGKGLTDSDLSVTLSQREVEELYAWLDRHYPHPVDQLSWPATKDAAGLLSEERQGHEVWLARVTLNYRALAIKRPDGYLWFWIGDHKAYDT